MRPTKRKERRRSDRLALIERRRGELWTYGQIPVCAALIACFIQILH